MPIDADSAVLVESIVYVLKIRVVTRQVQCGIASLQFKHFFRQFYDPFFTTVFSLLQIKHLIPYFAVLLLKTLNFFVLAYQVALDLLLPHLASFKRLLCPFQFHLQKPESFIIVLLSGGVQLVIDVFGLMGDHESDLRLHHSHYFVDAVQFVLALHFLPIKEVGSPDISEEVVADEFLFERLSGYLLGVRGERVFPLSATLDLCEHHLTIRITNCIIITLNLQHYSNILLFHLQ